MTRIELAGIIWGSFATMLGIIAALELRKVARELACARDKLRMTKIARDFWRRESERDSALADALTEDLGITRADLAKWSTRWGSAMRLLGIAEKANGKLMARVLRYERETAE
jgi:hypothetical protein